MGNICGGLRGLGGERGKATPFQQLELFLRRKKMEIKNHQISTANPREPGFDTTAYDVPPRWGFESFVEDWSSLMIGKHVFSFHYFGGREREPSNMCNISRSCQRITHTRIRFSSTEVKLPTICRWQLTNRTFLTFTAASRQVLLKYVPQLNSNHAFPPIPNVTTLSGQFEQVECPTKIIDT